MRLGRHPAVPRLADQFPISHLVALGRLEGPDVEHEPVFDSRDLDLLAGVKLLALWPSRLPELPSHGHEPTAAHLADAADDLIGPYRDRLPPRLVGLGEPLSPQASDGDG